MSSCSFEKDGEGYRRIQSYRGGVRYGSGDNRIHIQNAILYISNVS